MMAMTYHILTVGDAQQHAATLGAMISALLTGLAAGKYDPQVAFTEGMLGDLSIVFPPAAMVDQGLEAFLLINKMGGLGRSGPVVPDGFGGEVSQEWAQDKRHWLNADGSFKY
jgi:hypothetical protein